jgi:integrase
VSAVAEEECATATVTTVATTESHKNPSENVVAKYGTDECWSAAIAVLVSAACRLLERDGLKTGNDSVLRGFCDPAWVKDHGADYISTAFCANWRYKPNDAIPAFVKVLNAFKITSTGQSLHDLVGHGRFRPAQGSAIGGLRFSKFPGLAVGHWTSVLRQDDGWAGVDGEEVRPVQDVIDVCYWLFRRGDRNRRAGAGNGKLQRGEAASRGAAANKKPLDAPRLTTKPRPVPEPQPTRADEPTQQAEAADPKVRQVPAAPTPQHAPHVPRPQWAKSTSATTPPRSSPTAAAVVRPAVVMPLPRSQQRREGPAPAVAAPRIDIPVPRSRQRKAHQPSQAPVPSSPTPAAPPPTSSPSAATSLSTSPPSPPPSSPSKEKKQKPDGATATRPKEETRGCKRHNQNGAFVNSFAGVGEKAKNESKRDCGIIAALIMLAAIAQTLVDCVATPLKRPTTPHTLGDLVWRALFQYGEETVGEVRRFLHNHRASDDARGFDEDGRPLLLDPAEVLPILLPGLVDLGVSQNDLDAISGEDITKFPLEAPLVNKGQRFVLGYVINERLPALKHTALALGHGVTAKPEAVLWTSDVHGGVKAAEGGRHFTVLVRQRAQDTAGQATRWAEKGNGFRWFDDGHVSSTKTLQKLIETYATGARPGPYLALFRLVNAGVPLPPASAKVPGIGPSGNAAPWQEASASEQRRTTRSVADVVQSFRLDHSRFPLVVQMKGKHLRLLTIFDTPQRAYMAVHGVSQKVRRRHRNLLRDVQRLLPEDLLECTLDEALVRFVQRQKIAGKRNKPWAASTTHRNMAALTGAFTDLPLYTDFPSSVNLSESPVWKAAMRAAKLDMIVSESVNKPAMRYADVEAALAASKADPQVQAAIMVTWLCAGRVGDATQFHKEDFVFDRISPATEFLKLRILVRRGKAAKLAQPHTVYTVCPPHWRDRFVRYLDRFAPNAPLFNRATEKDWGKLSAAINRALRANNKDFGQRALRRGALQTIAADETVDLETIRTFSGHTGDDMLLRYLNWGLEAGKRQRSAQKAALALTGASQPANRLETASTSSTASTATATNSSSDTSRRQE